MVDTWPLWPEWTAPSAVSEEYEECAALFVPLHALTPGALTPRQIAGRGRGVDDYCTPWRLVLSVFEELVLRAATTSRSAQFYVEGVVSATSEPLGYRYWLLYTAPVDMNTLVGVRIDEDTDGLPAGSDGLGAVSAQGVQLSDIYGNIVENKRNLSIVANSEQSKPTERAAARRALALLKKRKDYQPWKDTDAHEVAKMFSIVVGLDIGTLKPFDPLFCFQHVHGMHASQTIGNYATNYKAVHGRLNFPLPQHLLAMPASALARASPFSMMLPHEQARAARSELDLTVLTGALLAEADAAAPTAEQQAFLDAMRDSGAMPLQNPSYERKVASKKRRATRAPDDDTSLVYAMEEARTPTVFSVPHEKSGDALVQIEKADLPPIARRRLTLLVRAAAGAAYRGIDPQDERYSEHLATLEASALNQDLYKMRPEDKMFFVQRDYSMGPLAHFQHATFRMLEYAQSFSHLHELASLVVLIPMDAYREEPGLHLNIMVISLGPGTGKSKLWEAMERILTKHTILNITYETRASHIAGKTDQNNGIHVHDELNPRAVKEERDGEGGEVSIVKQRLSGDTMLVVAPFIDDNGKRSKVYTMVQTHGSFLCSLNMDAAQMSAPVLDRFVVKEVPEPGSVIGAKKRDIVDMFNEEELRPRSMATLEERVQRTFSQMQLMFAMQFKLERCGGIAPVSMDLVAILNSAVFKRAKEYSKEVRVAPRSLTRLKHLARILAMRRAQVLNYLVPDENLVRKMPMEISSETMPSMERDLFVDVEAWVMAFFYMADTFLSPLQAGVTRAIGAYFEGRIQHENGWSDALFHYSGQLQGDKINQKPDYRFLRVHREALCGDLRQLIKRDTGVMTNSSIIMTTIARAKETNIEGRAAYVVEMLGAPVGMGARETERCVREWGPYLLFHVEYVKQCIESSKSQKGKRYNPRLPLMCAVRDVLSTPGQMPRKLAIGADFEDPSRVAYLHTGDPALGGKPSDLGLSVLGEVEVTHSGDETTRNMETRQALDEALGVLKHLSPEVYALAKDAQVTAKPPEPKKPEPLTGIVMEMTSSPGAEDIEMFPELQALADQAKNGRIVVDRDLDAWALHRHNERLGITEEAVDATIDITVPGDSGFLAGVPVVRLQEDSLARHIRDNKQTILADLNKPAQVDLDHDEDKFKYYRNGSVTVYDPTTHFKVDEILGEPFSRKKHLYLPCFRAHLNEVANADPDCAMSTK